MLSLRLTSVGNSLGVVLPKEALDRLHLGKGDRLYLTESPDGYANDAGCVLTMAGIASGAISEEAHAVWL